MEAGDTLTTVARTYHLTPNRIAAVNPDKSSLEKGNVLLIPAVWHEEPTNVKVKRASYRGGHSQRQLAAAIKSSKSSAVRRGTHISASRPLSARNGRS